MCAHPSGAKGAAGPVSAPGEEGITNNITTGGGNNGGNNPFTQEILSQIESDMGSLATHVEEVKVGWLVGLFIISFIRSFLNLCVYWYLG